MAPLIQVWLLNKNVIEQMIRDWYLSGVHWVNLSFEIHENIIYAGKRFFIVFHDVYNRKNLFWMRNQQSQNNPELFLWVG